MTAESGSQRVTKRNVHVLLDSTTSTAEEVARTLRSVRGQRAISPVITIVRTPTTSSENGHGVAGPDPVLWIQAGTELLPAAVGRLLAIFDRFDACAVYADGRARIVGRTTALRRPDYSPLRLLEQDYLGDAVLVRLEAGAPLPSSRLELQLHVLSLDAGAVVHVPETLARRQTSIPTASDVERRAAIAARLARAGINAQVETTSPGELRIRFPPIGLPLVSIIIPSRGSSAFIRGRDRVLLVEAVRSIVERSSYPAFEFVIVADDETPQSVIDDVTAIAQDRVRIVRWSQPFNFSAKINRGAAHARGELLLLLNDDVELISTDWLETMIGLCQMDGVGMVGAELLFEDGTLQHAGHFYRARGADHIALGWSPEQDDGLGAMRVDREVAGVTAACALVSRELFAEVGGFSTLLPGNYNDVDFSLKVRRTGARIIWTPWARLYHFESMSREPATADAELQRLRARWGTRMEVDPYWPEDARPVG